MELRRLKTLIAISETGTFAGAAKSVHVTQAAVSQQMKSLEQDLKTTLFDRTKRPPQLNSLGLALTAKARTVVHAYDAMLESLDDGDRLQGQLMLGAVPTTMTGLVPQTVNALKTLYPELHIRITPGLSADLLPLVDRNNLDCAIISEPYHIPSHMLWIPFSEEPLILLAPRSSTSDDPVELIEDHPFIRFSRKAWVGNLIDQWLEKNQIRVRESMELDTLEAISSMVYHELGVSIVPNRSVPSPNPLPVKRLPLGLKAQSRILGLAMRRDNANTRFIRPLCSALVEIVRAAGQAREIPMDTDQFSDG